MRDTNQFCTNGRQAGVAVCTGRRLTGIAMFVLNGDEPVLVCLYRIETNQCWCVCTNGRTTSVAVFVQAGDLPVLLCLYRIETNQCCRVCKEWRLTAVAMCH